MTEQKPTLKNLNLALKEELSPRAKQLLSQVTDVLPGAMIKYDLAEALRPSVPGVDRTTTAHPSRTVQTTTEPVQREPRSLAKHPGNPARAPQRPPGTNVVRLEPDHFDRC